MRVLSWLQTGMPDWGVCSLCRQHMQLTIRLKFGPDIWTLHATSGLQNCIMKSRIVFFWKIYENGTLSFLSKTQPPWLLSQRSVIWIMPAHTDCVPSWTAKFVVNSGINYFTKWISLSGPADHLWPARFGATAFSSVILEDWWKNPYKCQRKENISLHPHFILSNFKIIQPFKFVSSSNPMDYREIQRQFEQTIISDNFSTVIFWVWINHQVPTLDIWPSITHPYP